MAPSRKRIAQAAVLGTLGAGAAVALHRRSRSRKALEESAKKEREQSQRRIEEKMNLLRAEENERKKKAEDLFAHLQQLKEKDVWQTDEQVAESSEYVDSIEEKKKQRHKEWLEKVLRDQMEKDALLVPWYKQQEEEEKREEVARLDRIKNRDTQISNHYEMMHQRLVGN